MHIYRYSDGTLVVQSDDMRGLVPETDKFPAKGDELLRIVVQLLAANRGLTDDRIASTVLSAVLREVPYRNSQQALVPSGLRLVMRDATDRAAV